MKQKNFVELISNDTVNGLILKGRVTTMGERTSQLIQAIQLEDFINRYVPKHWTCPLQTVVFVPGVTTEDIFLITRKDIIPAKFNKSYFTEAINKWKEQNSNI